MAGRPLKTVVLGGVTALALLTIGMGPMGAQSSQQPLEASEVGITPKEIHVAVIADVENPLVPGLFKGSVDGMRGFAKYINAKGGLAGRKVVIDFIDSHLSADDARNALIKACTDDFATVGTIALFMNNVDDAVSCADKSGTASGLPDLPAFTVELAQGCSPVSHPVSPYTLDCTTQTQTPQTWRANTGQVKYYQRLGKKKLHGTYVYSSDLKSGKIGGLSLQRALQAAGIKADGGELGISSLAPQSAMAPVIQAIKDHGSNYELTTGAVQQDVAVRKEGKLQGLTGSDLIWECAACYDQNLIEQGGDAVDGQYVPLFYLPFNEGKYNKSLANFVKYTGKDKINSFAAYGWATGFLLREAVNAVVAKSGKNGLTRQALSDELEQVHAFDADGFWGKTDVGNHVPTPCFILMQVQNGKFVRVFPKKPGTFDCSKSNLTTYKSDILGE